MTLKIVNDANDVIERSPRMAGGKWDRKSWDEFVPRLKKWMSLWEETEAARNEDGTADSYWVAKAPGVADVIT